MAPNAILAVPADGTYNRTVGHYSGVTLYEPDELVLSAKAGTPVAELETLLEENGQAFQFEPMDYGPLLGQAAGRALLEACLPPICAGPAV